MKKDVIVCIGTVGRPTFEKCYKHVMELKKRDPRVKKVVVIRDQPSQAAWLNEMMLQSRGYTWCLQVDEDMYVNPDCVNHLLGLAKEKEAAGNMILNVHCMLDDIFLESKVGSLKLWRVKHSAGIEFVDTLASDRDFAKKGESRGMLCFSSDCSMGDHDSAPNEEIAYSKYREYVEKIRTFGDIDKAKNFVKSVQSLCERKGSIGKAALSGMTSYFEDLSISLKEEARSDSNELKIHEPYRDRLDTSPLVSVIISAKDQSLKKIRRCITSILSQTHKNIEIILLDDFSEKKITIPDFPSVILYRASKNYGPYVCRNFAIQSVAKGDFITFVDSDDWIEDKYIEGMLDAYRKSNCKIVYSHHTRHSLSGSEKTNFIAHSTSFYKKSLHDDIGFFDQVFFAADWEFRRRVQSLFGKDSVAENKSYDYHYEYNLSETALTSKFKNNSKIRKDYHDSHDEWHSSSKNKSDFFIEFPQKKRKFKAPDKMISVIDTEPGFDRVFSDPHISICVPIKNRTIVFDRDGNELRLFYNFVKTLVSLYSELDLVIELIVVDYESDDVVMSDILEELIGDTFHYKIVTVSRSRWSLGESRNVSASVATSDVLFFTDADMRFESLSVISDAYRVVKEGHAFFPICFSESNPKDEFMMNMLKSRGLDQNSGGWVRKEGFGIAAMSKKLFYSVGGYLPLKSWGGEDNDIYSKIKKVSKVHREFYRGFVHQWHPHDLVWKSRFYDG
jgi:glycosyltransferase involved in cell wall biosynthesis